MYIPFNGFIVKWPISQAGDDAQSVRWQRVSSNIPLFASHQAMLRKVAELHNAAF